MFWDLFFRLADALCSWSRAISILFCLFALQTLFAQGLDCSDAGIICDGSTIVYDPIGAGNNDFAGGTNSGCINDGEHLSAWYFFELNAQTPPGTELTFVIVPDAGSDQDYDFAVWGPTTNTSPLECGNLGNPTRCSYAACGFFCDGETGLSTSSNQNSESSFGDGFVRELIVNPGEGYWLMVDNFDNNNTGFSLNWNSAGQYLNCEEEPMCGGVFVDPGGLSGNYQNNSTEEYTICPDDPNTSVMLDFTSFDLPCGDAMNIYNGTSAAAPILGSVLCGTTIPGPFISTDVSGCLFITFTSDGTTTGTGWTADISCEDCVPGCTDITVQACDDGDPCTENDMETVDCDDSECVPCAGTPVAACTQTTTSPCDDGDPCTENDEEVTDDCSGDVCVPCAGTPLPACTSTTVRPCDDSDPCTENDMETVDDCTGDICIPCAGTALPACTNISVRSCDDGDDCTEDDMETVDDCTGDICIPCTGTPVAACTLTSTQSCDDGDPCTLEDMETVDDCTGDICIPCTGRPAVDCEITSIRPCDDGDDCTENDMETVDDCNGNICVPCAGTTIDCSNGATSIVPCDDDNACTENDVQEVLDCNGTICVPCAGIPLDCSSGTTSPQPCDDGNDCTINDVREVLDCDGSVCIPCQGTPIDCSNSPTSIVPCDDEDPCTINDVQTTLDCNGSICIPCQGTPLDCSTGPSTVVPCESGALLRNRSSALQRPGWMYRIRCRNYRCLLRRNLHPMCWCTGCRL